MANNLKVYVFVVAFVILAVDFGDHEKTIFVDGNTVAVKHADDHIKEPMKVDPERDIGYDAMLKRMEQRRNALNAKGKEGVAKLSEIVGVDVKEELEVPSVNIRRQVSNDTVDDNVTTSTVKST